MTEENSPAGKNAAPQFAIVRIYLKDVSFETPNSPDVFNENFRPEVNLQFGTAVKQLPDDLYEVVLNVTATSKDGDRTGFLVEVQQAGIFHLSGFDDVQTGQMLNAYCPNVLFPYVREAISDLVSKGTFPQLLLAHVDFDLLYQQKINQLSAKNSSKEETA